jgi:hypothetical protein
MQVFANYGAMFPRQTLTIGLIANGIATATNEEGETTRFNVADVRNERPTSGSPIGIYWNERDAY